MEGDTGRDTLLGGLHRCGRGHQVETHHFWGSLHMWRGTLGRDTFLRESTHVERTSGRDILLEGLHKCGEGH